MTTARLSSPSAATLHEQLQLLERERATAKLAGLADELYLADLAVEIDATRDAYIGTAVTEIASLRAEIDGPLHG